MLPVRQWNLSAFETVMKWLASGPSMITTRPWKMRTLKIGPYSS